MNNKNYINRLLRLLTTFVIVLSLTFTYFSLNVFAESSVSISGGDNVKGGDTFIVAVTFSGGDVGRVDAQLTYDTDQLTYISGGTSKGNTGYIQLKSAGTEGAIVFNIKFQAVSESSANISVTTNEMYDMDEMPMDTPSASKVINIKGNVSDDEKITEPADEEQPVEETTLPGVDEMSPEDQNAQSIIEDDVEVEDNDNNLARNIIIGCAVLVIVIVIISILAGSTNKRKRTKGRR